jgi:hypothetical protein
MKMNAARRKLVRDPSAKLDDWMPSLALMDDAFDILDRRPMDIIRLRIEVLHVRGEHQKTEREATELIRRAELIEGDVWLRHYFLVKGWYHVGCAQYLLGREDARLSILTALRYMDEFAKVDPYDMFNLEKVIMLNYFSTLDAVGQLLL